jgi:hypothetical protein
VRYILCFIIIVCCHSLFLFFGFGLLVGWLVGRSVVIGRDAGRCTDLVGAMYLYRSFLGRLQWSVEITSTLEPIVHLTSLHPLAISSY